MLDIVVLPLKRFDLKEVCAKHPVQFLPVVLILLQRRVVGVRGFIEWHAEGGVVRSLQDVPVAVDNHAVIAQVVLSPFLK